MSGAGVETEKWVSENHFTFVRQRLTVKIREGVGGAPPHLAPKEGRTSRTILVTHFSIRKNLKFS